MTNTDLRPGDRVRVTFEGVIENLYGDGSFSVSTRQGMSKALYYIGPSDTFEKIARPARPLEVGEVVTGAFLTGQVKVVAADGNHAWCLDSMGWRYTVKISDLSRPCGTPITPAKE